MFAYRVGGSLAADDPTYIERESDTHLYAALRQGELCYVLASRQMGKSSLRLRVRQRLESGGYGRCATIDLTRIGSRHLTMQQWYQSVAFDLIRSFQLSATIDLSGWWAEQSDLSPVQKLGNLIEDVLLKQTEPENLFIFIDETDSIQGLDFPVDDFFALIRYCHQQKQENSPYTRLTWALFGVISPSQLIHQIEGTPFNIGTEITLRGFSLHEAMSLVPGLEAYVEDPQQILASIITWTEGQPFLTQKLCALVQKKAQEKQRNPTQASDESPSDWVSQMIQTYIIDDWQINDEPEHLRTIQRMILHDPAKKARLLELYHKVLTAECTNFEDRIEDFPEMAILLLTGLIIKEQGVYRIQNRIYRDIFSPEWVNYHLARLRPYEVDLAAWIQSNGQDDCHLLSGTDLLTAEIWSQGKSLSTIDYQFLAASQLRERRYREKRIVEVLSVLHYRSGNLNPYLTQIAQAVSELVRLDWSIVTLCRGDEEKILGSSMDLAEEADEIYSLHLTLTDYVVSSGELLMVEDTAIETRYGLAPDDYRAYLGIPLKLSTGEVIGTICCFHLTPRQFSEDEIMFVTILAERAASAIENYQLYQKLEAMNCALRAHLQHREPFFLRILKGLWSRLSRSRR